MPLKVITVQLGPAENDAVVHLELVDGTHAVIALHHFHSLGPRLYGIRRENLLCSSKQLISEFRESGKQRRGKLKFETNQLNYFRI